MSPETALMSHILAFLMAAVVVVFLFRRISASPILGYLVAGILIGPHVLKIVSDPTEINFLGELGVLFLLFAIGLELPLHRLQSMKRYVFGLGSIQVIVTGTVFAFIGMWAGLSNEVAILVGGAFSLSSTAVVLQVLNERHELATRFGRATFSILLFQDLFVVLLLILATNLGTEGTSIHVELSTSLLKAIIALGVIIGIGRLILRPIYRAVAMSGSPELFMATSFLVVLGTGYVTEISGLSMELGAFLAGILLAETEYRHQIEADIQPFRGLLLGVFFMSVGMWVDIGAISHYFWEILGLLVLMLFLKTIIVYFLSRLMGLTFPSSTRVAFFLAGGGEFVFVIFSPQIAQGLLPPGYSDILYSVVILSMALTPFLATLGKWFSETLHIDEPMPSKQIPLDETGELKNHIVIAGFGRVGHMLAEILTARLIPFVAIDTDMRRVAEGREKGWPVFYGDVRKLEVLKAIKTDQAKAVVVTLNQMTPSVRTVTMIRRHYPELPICVRIKDHKHQEKLLDSGARLVVPETVEPTIQLASSVFHILGLSPEETSQLIDSYRRKHAMTREEKEA